MKAEHSGAQNNNVEVRARFVRLETGAHNNFCSKELEDYRGTTFIFPLHSRYPRGFVASVQKIAGECIDRAVLICGRQYRYPVSISLLSGIPSCLSEYPRPRFIPDSGDNGKCDSEISSVRTLRLRDIGGDGGNAPTSNLTYTSLPPVSSSSESDCPLIPTSTCIYIYSFMTACAATARERDHAEEHKW
jgi:hypothetical protein